MLQCLIFGYAASFDLNSVAYAVLTRTTAPPRRFARSLGRLGIFQRQATWPRRDIAAWIDSGRALLVIQIDQGFRAHLLAGDAAPLEVIADGRNSNTAGTALGYLSSRGRGLQRRLAIHPWSTGQACGSSPAPGTTRISTRAGA
jgi:ABC-2 type transport system permease protein